MLINDVVTLNVLLSHVASYADMNVFKSYINAHLGEVGTIRNLCTK